MKMNFCNIDHAVDAVARGQMIIVVDAEDRENEGDFLVAAEKITPEIVHFMITHGRGQLCVPITANDARRLNTQPIVPDASMDHARFAVPLDHNRCDTGVSPVDRAITIRAIADPTAGADDFVRPGHIFPLIAHDQGVLARPGHTESAIELTRLAQLHPAGVLCEICSADGKQMARNEELADLARRFRLPVLAIDSLIELRRKSIDGMLNLDYAPTSSVVSPAADEV